MADDEGDQPIHQAVVQQEMSFPDTGDAQVDGFIRQLRYIKGRVTYHQNRLIAESPSIVFLETTLSRVIGLHAKFIENSSRLIEIDQLPDAAEVLEESLQSLQETVKQKLDSILLQTGQSSSRGRDSTAREPSVRAILPKLPDLPMPRFSGDRKQWLSYRKYVSEMIEPRSELTSLSKYQYLETSCTDKAQNLISSSGSDFVTAWSRLCSEYDNDVVLKQEILEQLYDVKTPESRSPSSLNCFIDTIETCLSQLSIIQVNTVPWDLLLTFHLKRRLDLDSLTEFEKQRTVDTDVKLQELLDFLKRRVKLLTTTTRASTSSGIFAPQASSTPKDKGKPANASVGKSPKHEKTFHAGQIQCALCSQAHLLSQCFKAKKLPADELKKLVTEKKLCFNCLRAGHNVYSCQSKGTCYHCQRHHHTFLHKLYVVSDSSNSATTLSSTLSTPATDVNQSASGSPHQTTSMAVQSNQAKGIAVLATAIVYLKSRQGQKVPCRAFLDAGSTVSFITTELAFKLQLPRVSIHTIVDGINGTETVNKQQINTELSSRFGNFEMDLDFLITRKITGDLPQQRLLLPKLQFSTNELADPAFGTPGKIDVLLGCDVFYSVFEGEKTQLDEYLWACPSKLGIVIGGRTSPFNRVHTYVAIESLRRQVQRFWEVESLQGSSHFSLEEKATESHYASHVHRRQDSHYEVALPFKPNIQHLGDTAAKARALFLASERKLQHQEDKKQHYVEFMEEMMKMGHMVRSKQSNGYFMTHHLISRPSSTTTKHRVVFNASFQSSSGLSLNDTLMIGPTIQADVLTHLLRWRELKVGTTADLEKMYRMIFVREEDQRYQQIWWRSNPVLPLLSYQLTTVTYGTASAPFQATRCLKQLAHDEHQEFSDVTAELESQFYMDDYSASFNDSNDAARTKDRLSQLLLRGGFNCRKWNSNDPSLNSPEVDEQSANVLGVKWCKTDDTIRISFPDVKQHEVITKCSVLSETAQLFDPLGLAAPVVVLAKLFIQQLWLDGLDWTDELSSPLAESWKAFRETILLMQPIPVSRTLLFDGNQSFTLHGFADASTKAFGACIYLVAQGRSTLVVAKSRVAPTKTMTIPRLELAAALLLAQLMERVRTSLRSKPSEVFYWTDSQITFYRIRNVSSKYATFVAVRIAEIQQLTDPNEWQFIPSEHNPADIVSRGMSVDALRSCKLWWHGPTFLTNNNKAEWPAQLSLKTAVEDSEIKQKVYLVTQHHPVDATDVIVKLVNDKSSLKSMVNIVVYTVRIYINLMKTKAKKYFISGGITLQEREDALLRCYRSIQSHYFHHDYELLTKKKQLLRSSNIIALNPYIDEDGLIRVGGRLTGTSLETQQQILLPSCQFSRLVLEEIHRKHLHAGPQALLAFSRQVFWIIGGRSLCRSVVHKCILCFKRKPRLLKQIMASLHEERSQPEVAFEVVGIDYAGPFLIKPLVRSRVQQKAYIALFTCYKYRCTHLEIVYDLTTISFMNALKRFVGRRGIPRKIFSDNATNLVGGRKELNDLRDMLLSQSTNDAVKEYCVENRIHWNTIPARSPHFGGTWESMVKQFKYHFNRSLTNTYLHVDELQTLVVQIEAVLNSRPLTPISSCVEDLNALTPGHFMMLKPINLLPEPSWTSSNINRLQSWQLIQSVVGTLAEQFKKLYFSELQRRNKWISPEPNVPVGSLVLLYEENLPPTKWRLGRITEVKKGADDKVRSVNIKTTTGMTTRAIQRIAPLPLDEKDINN